MRRFLPFVCLVILSSAALAQNNSPLSVESSFWALKFYDADSNQYKLSELIKPFEGRQPAHQLIRKANNQHDLALFCQISGGFLTIYPFVSEALDREANYNMSLIGIGLIGVSIPIEISARRKAYEAVLSYNQSLNIKPQAALKLGFNGLGFCLRF